MKKRALIIAGVILLTTVIVGVILIVRSGPSPEEGKPVEGDKVVVSQAPSGWKLIKHPVFGTTFELPPAWKITVFENGRGRLEGRFDGEGITAVVNVNRQDNLSRLTPEEMIKDGSLKAVPIIRNSITGASYTTKVTADDSPGFIENSYLLANRYFPADKLLDVSCGLSGSNYKTMILTCELILKSLQFIQ